MLCQDYLTYGTLATQSAARGSTFSGHCRICPGEWDDVRHILTECLVTQPAREALLPQVAKYLAEALPSLDWDSLCVDAQNLSQFLVDPCSMNLKNDFRVPLNVPNLSNLIALCRELCFRSHNLRSKALSVLKMKK